MLFQLQHWSVEIAQVAKPFQCLVGFEAQVPIVTFIAGAFELFPGHGHGNKRLLMLGANGVHGNRGFRFNVLAPIDEYFPDAHSFGHFGNDEPGMLARQLFSDTAREWLCTRIGDRDVERDINLDPFRP